MLKERITPMLVKQKVYELPSESLQEVYDFMEFLVMKAERAQAKRIRELEGLWEGLRFEQLSSLEEDIRALRDESEEALLKRFERCSTLIWKRTKCLLVLTHQVMDIILWQRRRCRCIFMPMPKFP